MARNSGGNSRDDSTTRDGGRISNRENDQTTNARRLPKSMRWTFFIDIPALGECTILFACGFTTRVLRRRQDELPPGRGVIIIIFYADLGKRLKRARTCFCWFSLTNITHQKHIYILTKLCGIAIQMRSGGLVQKWYCIIYICIRNAYHSLSPDKWRNHTNEVGGVVRIYCRGAGCNDKWHTCSTTQAYVPRAALVDWRRARGARHSKGLNRRRAYPLVCCNRLLRAGGNKLYSFRAVSTIRWDII